MTPSAPKPQHARPNRPPGRAGRAAAPDAAKTPFVAFLRGINVGGNRVIAMADLRAAFEKLGLDGAKTLLASGNVLFDAPAGRDERGLAAAIEAGLRAAFSADIGVILRTREALAAMVRAAPFAKLDPAADVKRYVTLLAEPLAKSLPLPFGAEGDFEIVGTTERDVFCVAYRTPEGRYGPGLDAVDKHFAKKTLVTTRNWNTIVKASA